MLNHLHEFSKNSLHQMIYYYQREVDQAMDEKVRLELMEIHNRLFDEYFLR